MWRWLQLRALGTRSDCGQQGGKGTGDPEEAFARRLLSLKALPDDSRRSTWPPGFFLTWGTHEVEDGTRSDRSSRVGGARQPWGNLAVKEGST